MENKFIKQSLPAIANKHSKILILGSLPGDKSIKEKEYYYNPSNQFWKIIYSIFGKKEDVPQLYEEKIKFLYEHDIALWDVYSHAERKNSADENITAEEFNNIKTLLINYPTIKKILLNGKKAQKGFEKYIVENDIDCEYEYVPSSSSAHAINHLEKVECWKKAII